MLFMVHPEYRPKRPTSQFVARLYGFKIHPMAYQLQQVIQILSTFFKHFSSLKVAVNPLNKNYDLASGTEFQQSAKNDCPSLRKKTTQTYTHTHSSSKIFKI